MRVWVLGSGSKGNAVLLECGESRVLVDAGFPAGTIRKRLKAIGIPAESIEGVVITHEHSDHVRGAADGARRFGWRLHATAGTVVAAERLADTNVRTFERGGTLQFSHLELRAYASSHDAADPVVLVATARDSGTRVGIAYDLGFASSAVRRALASVDVLLLESNHDEGMLRAGPYPWHLKHRIASRTGHLSNRAAGEIARECVHRSLGDVVLAHLSEVNNDPRTATSAMAAALRRTGFRGRVTATAQRDISGPFGPGEGTAQLSFL
jgi:phosphoribosyl 1,2-cyclic phosphodiesterase